VRPPKWDPVSAMVLATFAHYGQTDKAGRDYIEHPRRVVRLVSNHQSFEHLTEDSQRVALMVAWLHDVLEDTRVTTSMLHDLGCSEEVNFRLRMLSRPRVSSEAGTARYYQQIKGDPIALLVKDCDIADNTSPARLAALDEPTRERLETKYAEARKALGIA